MDVFSSFNFVNDQTKYSPMANDELDFTIEKEDEENNYFEIPKSIKHTVTLIATIITLCILGDFTYIILWHPDNDLNLGLSPIFIFCVSIILIFQFPYKKMGIRPTKIGLIELETKIEGQSTDKSEEIAELQVKINELESRLDALSKLVPNGITSADNQTPPVRKNITPLVKDFLNTYSNYAFSPLRIKTLAIATNGFEDLAHANLLDIKSAIRELLATGIVKTKISKKGNTLYKIMEQ